MQNMLLESLRFGLQMVVLSLGGFAWDGADVRHLSGTREAQGIEHHRCYVARLQQGLRVIRLTLQGVDHGLHGARSASEIDTQQRSPSTDTSRGDCPRALKGMLGSSIRPYCPGCQPDARIDKDHLFLPPSQQGQQRLRQQIRSPHVRAVLQIQLRHGRGLELPMA